MTASFVFSRPCQHRRSVAAALLMCAALMHGCGPGDPPADYFFFPIEEGTEVDAELTRVDASAGATIAMKLGDVLLEASGDRALIGTAVEELHTHPEWIATVPGGVPLEGLAFNLSFRLRSDGSPYDASEEYTVGFALFEEAPEEPEETEIFLGSSLDGEGQLVARYDFAAPVPLYFDQCLGGAEPDCSGGVRVYSATNPGFAPHE
jgi:hypothetical protein